MNFIVIVLQQALPCILLALGVFLTFRILDFADMTAEGSFLIGSGITITSIYNGYNPFLATLFGFLSGMLCGVVTGSLNRFLKIPKLLSGIITMTAAASIFLIIMGVDPLNTSGISFKSQCVLKDGMDTVFSMFFGGAIPNQWVTILVMIAFIVAMMIIIYFFFGTEYGMAIRSTGMNEKMTKAQGINTTISTIVAIAISNGLIALAGALMAQKLRSVTANDSIGYLVVGLASILIGEAVFGKRSFKNCLISISLGTIVYFIIVQLAYTLGFPTALNKLLYAILIVFALCLPMIKKGFITLFYYIKGKFKKEAKV